EDSRSARMHSVARPAAAPRLSAAPRPASMCGCSAARTAAALEAWTGMNPTVVPWDGSRRTPRACAETARGTGVARRTAADASRSGAGLCRRPIEFAVQTACGQVREEEGLASQCLIAVAGARGVVHLLLGGLDAQHCGAQVSVRPGDAGEDAGEVLGADARERHLVRAVAAEEVCERVEEEARLRVVVDRRREDRLEGHPGVQAVGGEELAGDAGQ